jgi:ribosome biogenesis protein UTP30
VRQAVLALQKFHSTRLERKKRLIEENPLVSLIIGLKKIPNKTRRPYRIPIPHSLYPPEETELCLFSRTDKKTTKELLEIKGVKNIAKVIPLDKLKTDYKSYDSKKQLSAYYDVYLADRRIYHLLPRQLGKSFFIKKRFPFPVDVQKQDLTREIAAARDSTYLHLGLGSCVALPIARINYPTAHIVENIVKGMRGVVNRVPRGWRNIQVVHLKTVDSVALPIYHSLPPEAKLLAPLGEGPVEKRVKLSSLDVDEEEENVGELQTLGQEEGGGERKVSTAVVSTPPPLEQKKKVVRSAQSSRLARKKVRGSTVLSSRYEKLTARRRSHGRRSL